MTAEYASTFSPRISCEFCCKMPPLEIRGRRECRAPNAPAALRARIESTQASHHGHAGTTRHSPRNGFNGFLRALPGDRALLSPSSAGYLPRKLDASVEASGPHDFAVRKQVLSSLAPLASTASRPAFRDDREPPLLQERDMKAMKMICATRKAEYFARGGWTAIQ